MFEGKRESRSGRNHTLLFNGIPMPFVKFNTASELKSDVHNCSPEGTEIDQISVDSAKRQMGELVEVPRNTMLKYKDGIVREDGKFVTVTKKELESASAQSEDITRLLKVEPAVKVPGEFIKNRYFIGPQKGTENVFALILGVVKEKNYQISYNGVEGGQTRRCIVHFENDIPVLDVLYLESEVLEARPFVDKSVASADLKAKIAQLVEKMTTMEIEPISTTKVAQIEELFMAKAQGIAPKIEMIEKPKEMKSLEEALAVALK